jgi:hypothetical protein
VAAEVGTEAAAEAAATGAKVVAAAVMVAVVAAAAAAAAAGLADTGMTADSRRCAPNCKKMVVHAAADCFTLPAKRTRFPPGTSPSRQIKRDWGPVIILLILMIG